MADQPDRYHEALALVRMHGDKAPIYAAMEADAMLEAGDPLVRQGSMFWLTLKRFSGS